MKEVTLVVLGKEYVVKPTFRKIAAIEDMTERGVIEIYNDLSEGKIRIKDMATILFVAIEDRKVSLEAVGEEVMQDPASYIKAVVSFLAASMAGSDELSGGEGDDGSKEKNA